MPLHFVVVLLEYVRNHCDLVAVDELVSMFPSQIDVHLVPKGEKLHHHYLLAHMIIIWNTLSTFSHPQFVRYHRPLAILCFF